MQDMVKHMIFRKIAGDGVINSSKPLGSIFLPMPKQLMLTVSNGVRVN